MSNKKQTIKYKGGLPFINKNEGAKALGLKRSSASTPPSSSSVSKFSIKKPAKTDGNIYKERQIARAQSQKKVFSRSAAGYKGSDDFFFKPKFGSFSKNKKNNIVYESRRNELNRRASLGRTPVKVPRRKRFYFQRKSAKE